MQALLDRLSPFLTTRFLKFGAVGASGVLVNLGAFALFQYAGFRTTVASALAIEVSILSNFAFNELWTFGDRRDGPGGPLGRCLRFQLVSLVGAAIQWSVFVYCNVAWLALAGPPDALAIYFAGDASWFATYVVRPVVSPPATGVGAYVAQLCGIGVATGWNFLANFHWTWGNREDAES